MPLRFRIVYIVGQPDVVIAIGIPDIDLEIAIAVGSKDDLAPIWRPS